MKTNKETDPKAGPQRLTTTRELAANHNGNDTTRERCNTCARSAFIVRLARRVVRLERRVRRLESRVGHLEAVVEAHLAECAEVK